MPGRLRDVAVRAGVAKSTASLALKGGPNVSDEVRERVLLAARTLGYDLDRLGSRGAAARPRPTMRTGRLTALLLLPARYQHAYNDYFSPLVAEVRAAARELEVDLVLAPAQDIADDPTVRTVLSDERNPVDGIILMGVPDDPEHLAGLARWGKPAVLVGRQLEGDAARLCSSVGIHQAGAVALIVDHLLDLGHRRIVYVSLGRPAWSAEPQRLAGYGAALAERGIPFDAGLVFPRGQDSPQTWEAVTCLLRSGGATAVVCANDTTALHLRAHAAAQGVHTPHHYSLAGFDDVDVALDARLTTVSCEREQIARIGVELLHRQMRNPAIGWQHVVLRPRLIRRETTAVLDGAVGVNGQRRYTTARDRNGDLVGSKHSAQKG